MQSLKLLRSWNGYKSGEVVQETNNIAHTLIENGTAELFNPFSAKAFDKPPKDKMLDRRSKKVKIK